MIEQKDFEIYLYVKNDKFEIFLFDALTFKNIYTNELIINKDSLIDFKELIKSLVFGKSSTFCFSSLKVFSFFVCNKRSFLSLRIFER